jgi:hypothetical protein
MSATTGNSFWELRSKHGRDKLFETPQLLWEAACEYFKWCEENPLYETEAKVTSDGQGLGSSVEMVKLPKMRAFTMHGLCLYLDCSTSYFRTFKSVLKEGDKDFLTVINKIEEVVYNQKFTGAAAGFLNANIIARDLGLSDKVNTEHSGEVSVKQITGMEIL